MTNRYATTVLFYVNIEENRNMSFCTEVVEGVIIIKEEEMVTEGEVVEIGEDTCQVGKGGENLRETGGAMILGKNLD